MSLKDIVDLTIEHKNYIIIIILVAMSLIQFTPIKFNPWSWLFSTIGKALNKDLIDDIADLKKNVESLEYRFNEKSAIDCRARIIRFGDEVSHGVSHSRDNFQMIMHDITQYNQYCIEHPEFINNMTKITSERIEEDYKERDRNGDFL